MNANFNLYVRFPGGRAEEEAGFCEGRPTWIATSSVLREAPYTLEGIGWNALSIKVNLV